VCPAGGFPQTTHRVRSSRFLKVSVTLLEELVVTHVFTDLDKAAFLAEIQDLYQERIVAFIELFFESNPARLYPNFNDSIVAKELIEP
jgi:hypothetical protein